MSAYLFEREEDYNNAVDHLWRDMYEDARRCNDHCLYFHGYSSEGSAYRIDILNDCSDAPRAANIIREHCGKYSPYY